MRMKLVFCVILLMQACGPLLAKRKAQAKPKPDPPGIMQRLTEAKVKAQELGARVLGLIDTYYGDHIEPMTDLYTEWTSNIKGSVWETILAAIDDYVPFV